MQRGASEAALQDYGAAIAARPSSALARFNRGVLLDRLARLPEAVADFNAALELDPGNADFRHNRGFSLGRQVGHVWVTKCERQGLGRLSQADHRPASLALPMPAAC